MMIIKRSLKILSLVVSIVLITSLLTGCGLLNACTTYPETEGLEIGFRYENEGPMITAVKSDKNEFDIDDVTLDFYYGGKAGGRNGAISVVRGFANDVSADVLAKMYEDYQNGEGASFIKEIPIDEFNNGPHEISIRWSPIFAKEESRLYFHYREELTLPSDIFVGDFGTIYLFIRMVTYDSYNNEYLFWSEGSTSSIDINYTKTEDGTIILKKGFRD